MNAETIYKTLAVLIVLLVAFLGAWPKLKANNIFKSDLSNNYSDLIQVGPMAEPGNNNSKINPMYALWFSILLGICGSTLLIYHNLIASRKNLSTNYDDTGSTMFYYNLVILLAVFVHVLISDSFTTTIRNLKFTLKVWFSTIAWAPVVTLGIFMITKKIDVTDGEKVLFLYEDAIVFSSGLGSLTLLILIFAVNYVTRKTWQAFEKREIIFLVAESMIAITMLIVSMALHLGFYWLAIWIPNAIIIGLTIRYYKFDNVTAEMPEMVN